MDQLDESILRFLDGDMSQPEELELAQDIQNHPEGKEKLTFLMNFQGIVPAVLADAKPKTIHTKRKSSKRANVKVFAFVILSAAACIFFAFFLQNKTIPPGPIGSVTNLHGTVWVESEGARTALKKGMAVISGNVIEVESGSLELNLGNGRAKVILHNKTTAIIKEKEGILVHLEQGLISADVKPEKGGREVRFTTDQTEALVLGTKLRVGKKSGKSELEVLTGSVKYKCINSNDTVIVKQKQFAVATDNDSTPVVKDFPKGASGYLLWEKWNIKGKNYEVQKFINNPKFKQKPDLELKLPSFESPSEIDDYYGSRTSGLLHISETSEYTFWVAADIKAVLYLSTDQSMKNARKIAFVDEWCHSRGWDKSTKQKSKAIKLQKGKSYYISVIHIEDDQNDSVSVAWKGAGFEREIIPGRYLSPTK
jgi:hypothetical protein